MPSRVPNDANTDPRAVRKASSADVPKFAHALARAFYDDPPAKWFFPDDSKRHDQLERWFAVALRRLYLRHEECYTTENVVGGAIWVPPERGKLGFMEQIRLLPTAVGLFGRRLPAVLRAISGDSGHPNEPHYYLPFMGVDPTWQGKGLGRALLRPVLDRCDQDRTLAFLEATTPRNRDLYERVGFQVVEQTILPGGPPLWLMVRNPAS